MATLETVLNSDTKVQILRTLAVNDKSYAAEDLERETTKDITSIYKALEDLRDEKILKTIQTEGKTKYYKLDTRESSVIGMSVPVDFSASINKLLYDEMKQYGLNNLPKYPLNIVFDFRKKLIGKIDDDLEKIILFGSAANGEYTLDSDLDLYIVCKEAGVEAEDQIHEIAESYDHEFSLAIKSEKQYQEDFTKPVSKLADSIIKDGFTTLYGEVEEINQYIEDGGEQK
ncbi:nucleotidyltransferase domain-containing protein [Candidatus Nanohalobium constans]|uniref:Nucleotidyltransferase n=1 Tax=Candidatus Nanohalobium constans TaxID=2565781 RepID=A0A5Q0UF06_9ARCH|nr:nucleotidyltransferase domain-containing protein [Candidatus Nanohalobium constans]QGA80172.1 nucleotidyltransferase [Candidatus Nanohalobium constans]